MRAIWLLVPALICSCDEPKSVFDVGLNFPDAIDPQAAIPTVPLDAVHGFPLRVQVCAHVKQLEGALSAHVTVTGAGMGGPLTPATGTPVYDTMVALQRISVTDLGVDSTGMPGCGLIDDMGASDYYGGLALLSAPARGNNIVSVDVGGHVGSRTVMVEAAANAPVNLSPPQLVEVDIPTDGGMPADFGLVSTQPITGGIVYEAFTEAKDSYGLPIAGLSIAFTGTSGSATATFTPNNAVTDANGVARSLVLLTKGTQLLIIVAGGGTFNAAVAPAASAKGALQYVDSHVATFDGGMGPYVVDAGMGGVLYEVDAHLNGPATVSFAALASGTGGEPVVYPTMASGTAAQPAATYVLVQPGEPVLVAAQVGGTVEFAVVPSP